MRSSVGSPLKACAVPACWAHAQACLQPLFYGPQSCLGDLGTARRGPSPRSAVWAEGRASRRHSRPPRSSGFLCLALRTEYKRMLRESMRMRTVKNRYTA